MPRPLVIYWNNQPTPYVVARFNAVIDKGNVDLHAWFDTAREPDRSWELDPNEWRFQHSYLPKAHIGRHIFPFPDATLRQLAPDLLITPMDRIPGALAAFTGKALAARTASRTLPVYDTWVERSLLREISLHFLYRSLDGAKVSGADGASMAHRYGMPLSRTWHVTQSVDLDLYRQAKLMEEDVIRTRRRHLGLRGCTFIYVGRLWKGKGVNFRIRRFSRTQVSTC